MPERGRARVGKRCRSLLAAETPPGRLGGEATSGAPPRRPVAQCSLHRSTCMEPRRPQGVGLVAHRSIVPARHVSPQPVMRRPLAADPALEVPRRTRGACPIRLADVAVCRGPAPHGERPGRRYDARSPAAWSPARARASKFASGRGRRRGRRATDDVDDEREPPHPAASSASAPRSTVASSDQQYAAGDVSGHTFSSGA